MQRLAPQWLRGCRLRPCWFEPTFHKHSGRLCAGLQLHVEDGGYDHEAFQPWRAAGARVQGAAQAPAGLRPVARLPLRVRARPARHRPDQRQRAAASLGRRSGGDACRSRRHRDGRRKRLAGGARGSDDLPLSSVRFEHTKAGRIASVGTTRGRDGHEREGGGVAPDPAHAGRVDLLRGGAQLRGPAGPRAAQAHPADRSFPGTTRTSRTLDPCFSSRPPSRCRSSAGSSTASGCAGAT